MKTNEYINKYCVGCGCCHSLFGTELKSIDRGFPNVCLGEEDDAEEFKKICPVFNYSKQCEQDIWGVIQKAYVGYSSNQQTRYKASSGGAITEICISLLEDKEVDGIIHTTYHPEDPTKTITCISRTEKELISRCGSRYSISVPLYDILQQLDDGKKYAFVGKPCDVMALRNLLNYKPELKKQMVCLISFFCAGEPSVDAQKLLLDKMGCQEDECEELTYRGNGWPGYTTLKKKDGTISEMEYKEAWGRYLGRDLRNICRFCMDGTGDAADIVCADFWQLDNEGKPDFSEHEGRNIIITRTNVGTSIVNRAIEKNRLVCEEDFTDKMDQFHKYQPHQFSRKGMMQTSLAAMRLCGREVPRYNKTYLEKYASYQPLQKKLRYFLGTIKRILKGRI